MLKPNVSASSGTLNTLVAGSQVNGNAIFMGALAPKVSKLSAKVAVTAATATLTATVKWQGSNDKSTWVDLASSNNAANVTFTTGTAAIKTESISAPDAAYSWKYARVSVVTGVATGAAGDLYAFDYSYHQLTGAER